MKVKRLGFPTKHVIILMTWHPGSKEEQKTGDATLLQTEGQKAGWGEVVAVFFYLKVYIYIFYYIFFCFSVFYSFWLFLQFIFTIYVQYIYIYHIFAIYPWDIDVYLCFKTTRGCWSLTLQVSRCHSKKHQSNGLHQFSRSVCFGGMGGR